MLRQCLDILYLTAKNLREDEKSTISHSMRLWKKSKTPLESSVAVMHEVYSRNDEAFSLFHCDVTGTYDGGNIVDDALKLLSPRKKWKEGARSARESERIRITDNEAIIKLSRSTAIIPYEMWKDDQSLCEHIHESTEWTASFQKELEEVGGNSLARRVRIYDLEDMIETLKEPAECTDFGPANFTMPWKDKFYVRMEGSAASPFSLTGVSDKTVYLQPSEEERRRLIGVYSKALDFLRGVEAMDPGAAVYPPEEIYMRAKFIDAYTEEMIIDVYF